MIKDNAYRFADNLWIQGEQPSADLIAKQCEIEETEAAKLLSEWRQTLPDRISLQKSLVSVPDVPDVLNLAFSRLWQQAMEEATQRVGLEQRSAGATLEEAKRMSDHTVHEMQNRQLSLEGKIREQNGRIEEMLTTQKSLEAEINVLKSALASETTARKQEEQVRSNLEHDLAVLRKTHDDSKRTFDVRIKDEQRRAQDQISKSDADTRYYRSALEKLRDEVGKKESSLTKEIHDLKAEVAKRDVKTETMKTQLKSQEEELTQLKQDAVHQSRELARSNSALLAEGNKVKRFEDRVKELEAEIKRINQKNVNTTTDWSRRENALRSQLKERDEELMRVQSRVSGLEKRVITQDEEIRRLNSRL
jgi:chromosome segregation ATPase